MKITVIHGQSHQGSTYHIARELAEKLEGEITEFFLPRDFGEFCIGCGNCIMKSETLCPHYQKLQPIVSAMDEADVLIFASPVYVYHLTGAMKAFLDHFGYRWMVHRPEGSMFKKQAVCISTAAGGGMKSTNKDMADSAFFWGIAKIYKIGFAVASISWDGVNPKTKDKIHVKTDEIAAKIRKNAGHLKSGLKTKAFFFVMHLMQRKGFNEVDRNYWMKNEWTRKQRPWN